MRTLLLVLVLLLLASSPGYAQQIATGGEAYAYQVITVSNASIGLTATTVSPTTEAGASVMFCSVEAQPIRYRFDGTAPTSTVGHPAIAATTITLVGINNILRFRAIRSGGTDASLSCTLSR